MSPSGALVVSLGCRNRAAGELADADDVDAVGDALGLERGRVGELAVEEAGTDVGEEREVPAEREERGALGLLLGGSFSHFGPPTEPKRMASDCSQVIERGVGERLAVMVDARATDVGELIVGREVFLRGDVGEHALKGLVMTSGPM